MRPSALLGRVLVVALACCMAWTPVRAEGREQSLPAILALLQQGAVEAAAEAASELPASEPRAALARAAVAFYRGDYQAALAALPAAEGGETELQETREWLSARSEAAADATAGMLTRQEGDFVFRFAPGPDAILVDYALDAARQERAALSTLLGGVPAPPILIEVFPTTAAFIQASGLPQEWVETTGTVALSKWNRLLILSPRNMARGYPWKDTLAHEYVHLALNVASGGLAPVWFHEGSARVLEGAWRGSDGSDLLDPFSSSLLSRAARENAWVSFAEMHPSMAALPSSELAALAFATVAWAIDQLLTRSGPEGYRRVVERIAAGEDSLAIIEAELGLPPGGFESQVHRSVREAKLPVRANVAEIPLVLRDGAAVSPDLEGQALDPVLLADQDMGDKTRIGDLLRGRGHAKAALIEYERAHAVGPFHSPALANKRARTLRALGRTVEAREVLEESVALYPEYTPVVALLLELLVAEGKSKEAIEMAHRAISLNPFDPAVHQRLVQLYEAQESADAAEHERQVLRILAEGPAYGGK